MSSESHFDVAIIGAGLSALAAGIRLAHFGKKICLFERHNVVGGLNSFYSIDGRKYDVGLHAMTNFVPREVRGTALGKILRQLRVEREALDLCPQTGSVVRFPGVELAFNNNFALLESEVARAFPAQRDGFRQLVADIRIFDDFSLTTPELTARGMIRRRITDPLCEDMLLCPLLFYGSAQEHDMDARQFVIMFKAIFLEGLARPFDGIRVVLRALTERLRECGGQRRMKCGVARLHVFGDRVTTLELDSGEIVTAGIVLSSAGAVETARLCGAAGPGTADERVGRLSFVETVRVLRTPPAALGWRDTIVFFNDSPHFEYARPAAAVDVRSGVICIPNNFDFGVRTLPEGSVRTTCLANNERWAGLPDSQYREEKANWFSRVTASASRFLPGASPEALERETIATDMFTPATVRRFTGHLGGAIYGAPEKVRDGRTAWANLFLIGADQGYLGIVGAMLSGITMANLHGLQGRAE